MFRNIQNKISVIRVISGYFHINVLITFLLPLLVLCNCSLNKIVINTASSFMEEGISVVFQEDDLKIAEQFLASNLIMVEILIAKNPDNPRLNLIAAQGFGAFATGFIEDFDPDRASKLYLRGFRYSLNALPKKKRFDENITHLELESLLKTFTKREVPALFWIGFNWGSYILSHLDNPRMLVNLAKVEMIMSRVLELDETFNFAGVHLFYGSFYAARPPILGGDPEKGRKHFLRNMELTENKFLLAKVLYARYYAVQMQDKELFDQMLDEVLEANLDEAPEMRLMNAIAQRKAHLLKENEQKYF